MYSSPEQTEGAPHIPEQPGGDRALQRGVRYLQPDAVRHPGHPDPPQDPPGPPVLRPQAGGGRADPQCAGLDAAGLHTRIRAAGGMCLVSVWFCETSISMAF